MAAFKHGLHLHANTDGVLLSWLPCTRCAATQVCSPAELPACAIATALLLASAAAATLWAASAAHLTASVSQPGQPQQDPNRLAAASQADLHVSQQQQQQQPQQCTSPDTAEAKQELLGTVQQWLGVLGGGLLLQVNKRTGTDPSCRLMHPVLASRICAGALSCISPGSSIAAARR